eukprot:CAMPEP_0195602100 /NCGR_PEP_ID=MMETSP0815-20121206/5428_1 /TAXON_ID=97485 /ORGANISM="Prymnesium parvum, Strain Texoma1" /LENGTH=67 /DNA_ID=CAMNT_0040741665 /DNA_START=438 /DNA_END=637 /DNA_ORIENTATION=-
MVEATRVNPSSGTPNRTKDIKQVATTSSADAIALSTESRCLRKKPVTRPTVDMIAMIESTKGVQIAA